MPATNIKQSKSQTKKQTNKTPWIILGIAIALIALTGIIFLASSIYTSITNPYHKEQQAMEKYLEDKYKKDFVVGVPKSTGGDLGNPHYTVRAEAYPRDDEKIKFGVVYDRKDKEVRDGFIAASWQPEAIQMVKKDLMEIWGTTPQNKVNFGFSSSNETKYASIPPLGMC